MTMEEKVVPHFFIIYGSKNDFVVFFLKLFINYLFNRFIAIGTNNITFYV